MRSRSRASRLLGITGFLAILAFPVSNVAGAVRTSGRVILPAGDEVDEDLFSVGGTTIIEGTVHGDLIVVTGELRVTGTIEGDIIGMVGGTARIDGVVKGSVRIAAVKLQLLGRVDGDVASTAVEVDLRGIIERDVLLVAGEAHIASRVGRDLRALTWRTSVDGPVGGDVVTRSDRLTLGPSASVVGDVTYQAGRDVRLGEGAAVGGVIQRRAALAPIWAKAVSRVIAILGFFGLIVAGAAYLWGPRATAARSVRLATERPWRSAAIGIAVLLVLPLTALPLFLSLVGIPVALVLLVAWVLAVLLGPIPAVTGAGIILMRERGGLYGGLVVGIAIWRGAMWLLPLLAGLLYLGALAVGVGAFALAIREQRSAAGMVAGA